MHFCAIIVNRRASPKQEEEEEEEDDDGGWEMLQLATLHEIKVVVVISKLDE